MSAIVTNLQKGENKIGPGSTEGERTTESNFNQYWPGREEKLFIESATSPPPVYGIETYQNLGNLGKLLSQWNFWPYFKFRRMIWHDKICAKFTSFYLPLFLSTFWTCRHTIKNTPNYFLYKNNLKHYFYFKNLLCFCVSTYAIITIKKAYIFL